MTVADFYRVAGIGEKIIIRKVERASNYSYFELLYNGSVDRLPLDLFGMNVLDIRVSRETLSITITVE